MTNQTEEFVNPEIITTELEYIIQMEDMPICYFIAPLNAMIFGGQVIPVELSNTKNVREYYFAHKPIFPNSAGLNFVKGILQKFGCNTYIAQKRGGYYNFDMNKDWPTYKRSFVIYLTQDKLPDKPQHVIFVTDFYYGGKDYNTKITATDQRNMQKYIVLSPPKANLIEAKIYSTDEKYFGVVDAICMIVRA